MRPRLCIQKATALTLWTCFGAVGFGFVTPGTAEAWHVALVILAGQIAIFAALSLRDAIGRA